MNNFLSQRGIFDSKSKLDGWNPYLEEEDNKMGLLLVGQNISREGSMGTNYDISGSQIENTRKITENIMKNVVKKSVN